MLGPRNPDVGVRQLLNNFPASFAKWRYETQWEVLRHLLPLRDQCENKVDRALFAKAEELDNFFKACN